jgi:hypothetical protein
MHGPFFEFEQTFLTAKMPHTKASREKQRRRIHDWKPWEKSTGPKTARGKASTAQNARKHRPREGPTLAELRKDAQIFESLLRFHVRNPMVSALMPEGTFKNIVLGLLFRLTALGETVEGATAKVKGIIDSELRHAHRL